MKQFDIFTIQLAATKASPLGVVRPAVIISPDVMNTNLKTVVVAPLTLDIKAYPCRMEFEFEEQEFEIALDQMRAIEKSRLKRKLGELDHKTAENVKAIIQTMFS
jgi:mRNA interferase MazF